MTVTIYHNPACGTSRNVLGLIRNSGEEPTVVEYLKTPPSREELVGLIGRMGIPVRELLRQRGTPYDALGLDDPGLGDDALIDAMMAHPVLINRPIVVTPLGVKLCRPSEALLDLLPAPQRGQFAKEDGEAVVDARGARAETRSVTDRLPRRLVAEGIGTGLLLAAVVGSGIMAERLAGGNVGVALLANTLATAGALVALILAFGPVSGAHFNPAVTVALAWRGALPWRSVPGYLLAQSTGAVLGVWLAHAMFDLPVVQASARVRTGFGQWAGEFTATFALLSVVWGCARHRPHATPYAVASIIAGAYWFTSSTSFANPAVTAARAFSDTFAGIRPADVPAFVVVQALGAAAATALFAWFAAEDRPEARPFR